METVIAACISAAAAIVVCLANNHVQQAKNRALMEYKLDELVKRVDRHNSLIERVYKLEETAEVHAEKIKVANHRIEDLEAEAR